MLFCEMKNICEGKKLFFGPKETFLCFSRPVSFLEFNRGKVCRRRHGSDVGERYRLLSEMTSTGSFSTLRRSNLLKLFESVKLEFS